MSKPRIVILGAGPAGLGAAYRLAQCSQADVTVVEQNHWVGGNTASFDIEGLRADYGSHRLHAACDPEVLADIRNFLGDDLMVRMRRGRIRLRGRWIRFPLKPVDLVTQLPSDFVAGVAVDMVGKLFRSRAIEEPNFSSVLEAGLGRTICRDFYFPYARKIWGVSPEELSATQAYRRISADTFTRIIRKLLPKKKQKTGVHFFYPRKGYGQITEAYAEAAKTAGADIMLGSKVRSVTADKTDFTISMERGGGEQHSIHADYVWSTIPINILARCIQPAVPNEILKAAEQIDYRAMILIYLVIEQEYFSMYDAYYFPELEIPISRISEPKNFNGGYGPNRRTVLCAELPCVFDGDYWHRSDEELADLVRRTLDLAGIPVPPITKIVVKRLRNAYPIYRQGYEKHFEALDRWLSRIDRLLTFGRQGLFVHDNTHHALYMGYAASSCLRDDGSFDEKRWLDYRKIFETHVVED